MKGPWAEIFVSRPSMTRFGPSIGGRRVGFHLRGGSPRPRQNSGVLLRALLSALHVAAALMARGAWLF
jgi:hypothetical protein